MTQYYQSRGIELGALELVRGADKKPISPADHDLSAIARSNDLWSRRFPDPVTAFASGWMRVRARARQRGVTLPLVISDHADWDGLDRHDRGDRRLRSLGHARPGGRAGALVPTRRAEGAAARHCRLWRRRGSRGRAARLQA